MSHWTSKMESRLPALLRKIEAAGEGPSSIMVTMTTSDGPRRTAAQNYQILAIQRAAGRDPFFIGADERPVVAQAWRNVVAKIGLSKLRDAAEVVGRVFLRIYREHVEMGRSRGGAMAPLSASTLRHKVAAGEAGRPILEDTGELVGSLAFKSEQVK